MSTKAQFLSRMVTIVIVVALAFLLASSSSSKASHPGSPAAFAITADPAVFEGVAIGG
jgi:hypothetical protein